MITQKAEGQSRSPRVGSRLFPSGFLFCSSLNHPAFTSSLLHLYHGELLKLSFVLFRAASFSYSSVRKRPETPTVPFATTRITNRLTSCQPWRRPRNTLSQRLPIAIARPSGPPAMMDLTYPTCRSDVARGSVRRSSGPSRWLLPRCPPSAPAPSPSSRSTRPSSSQGCTTRSSRSTALP